MAISIGDALLRLGVDSSALDRSMTGLGKRLDSQFLNLGKKMSLSLTVPIIAFGAALFKTEDIVEDAFDRIRIGTGATGEALNRLKGDFKAVFAKVPQDAAQVGIAIADLNTRLGLTGQPLQNLTVQMLNLARLSKTEVGPIIANTTRLFGDWAIATEHQGDTLDLLFKVSQSTGIGIDSLAQRVVQFGAPLRTMGFSLEESLVLLGKWEKEGVNSELVLGSLRIAMGHFAQGNIPMREGLDQTIKKMQALGPSAEAVSLAMEVFGARAGPDMAAAILEGRFEIEKLLKVIQESPDTVNRAAADIEGFAEKLAMVRNQATLALHPLGVALLKVLESLLPKIKPLISSVAGLIEGFANLSPSVQMTIIAIVGIIAAIGPLLMILPSLIASIKVLIAAFLFLLTPMGLIILKIGAISAIIALLVRNWDWLRERTINIWGALLQFLGGVPGRIRSIFSTVTGLILSPFRVAFAGIGSGINWLIRQLNKINIKIPVWVPVIGGKEFGIKIPEIALPRFAKGGIIPEPTLLYGLRSQRPYAIAGERGPELVSPIKPGLGSLSVVNNFNISQLVVREEADIDRISKLLYDKIQASTRGRGYHGI
ncbi:MAG: hypothetical protein DDT42_01443 [candidate division WS2 bacterium]|uniref:Phage tail tape measure protein n=1 Tax=Psychracetigena formicireducens TaxID=2986056 RepID=A0A9E2BJF6_PSYF1|nr:hypothetical protein [Candidatus Psychracetigena formicireducens]